MGSLPPSKAREFEAAIMVSPRGGIEYMAGGANPHRRIKRRALVGTAQATATAKTKHSNKRKVKNNNPTFLSAKVCLDSADLFIHG
jgi:hypothetical protein